MKRRLTPTVTFVCLLLLVGMLASAASARLTGAVWTSLVDGTSPNHNVYAAKQDVYLNGGPNLLTGAGWIPPGYYYFQVTDPPGHTLLSTDNINCRLFQVDPSGIVHYPTPYTTPPYHNTGTDVQTGSTTIQLMPYLNSPNGEYKMWVTRVADYSPVTDAFGNPIWVPGNSFGFIPRNSKTDNFRVRRQLTIVGNKWEDTNGDGIWDGDEDGLPDWTIRLYRKQGNQWVLVGESQTAADGSYAFTGITQKGQYRICEVLQEGWEQTYPGGDGCWYLIITAKQIKQGATLGPFNFGNRQVIPPPPVVLSGVKYYDTNLNGQPDLGEPLLPFSVLNIWIHIIPLTPSGPPIVVPIGEDGTWTADIDPGFYMVCESSSPDAVVPPLPPWFQTGPAAGTVLSINVWEGSPAYPHQWFVNVLPGPPDPAYGLLDFGNVRLGGGNAHTKGYWQGPVGNSRIQQAWIDTINSQDPYNDPSDYSQTLDKFGNFVYNWVEPFDGLGNGGYVYPGGTLLARSRAEIADYLVDPVLGEMRLILAQQLLAMKLNVLSGDVDAWDLLQCNGTYMTAGDLIAAAEAAWAGTDSALQEALKNCLDAANNNLNWVLPPP